MPLTTSIFSGLAQGATQGYSNNFTESAKADRAEARERKKASDIELQKLNMRTDEDLQSESNAMSLQLRNTEMQLQQQNRDFIRQGIYSSLDRYTSDYDVRHLNQALRDAKTRGSTVFGDTARVDRLSEGDRELIRQAGLDPDLILNSEILLRQWVKTTDEDGDQSLQDIQETYAVTGYERYANNRELDRQIKAAALHKKAATYPTITERQAARIVAGEGFKEGTTEFDARFTEVITEMGASQGSDNLGSTAPEREVIHLLRAEGLTEGDEGFDARFVEELRNIRESDDGYRSTQREREIDDLLESEGLAEGDEGYIDRRVELRNEIIARDRQTATGRDLDAVEQAKVTIDERAQEEFGKDFFSIDFSDPSNRRRFENEINRIEQQGNLGFDTQDKRELHYVKSLLELGEPGTNLSERETGLIDNLFRDVGRYISNETQGAEARAAYNGFRNLMRHSLYGSVQTEANIKAFNDEFGNLSQQRGPILAQFNNALKQLKGKLEGLQGLNDSYVVHYRIGADQIRLAEIIDNLEDEITRFNSLEQQETDSAPSTGSTVLDEDARQSLDALMLEVEDQ